MNPFKGSLLRHNIESTIHQALSDELYDSFRSFLFEKSFDKKYLLSEEGKLCKYIYFIEQGSCYSSIVNEKGDKHAIQFALEGYWISDLYSFFSGKQAIFNIEALEPVKALLLNRESFDELCNAHPLFDRFWRILIQRAYVSLQYRLAKTNSEEAAHRYLEFSSLHPDFIERIPQYLIASYLGIKPQSLSRIRNELVQRKK
jgi:CRP-like cAMP-binding protein